MAYGKVNPTGCAERHGLIQVRLDFFLESGDIRYDDPRFYQIDQTSAAFLKGYKGKLDELGSHLDREAYAAWEASLPRIWLPERCFHHHFIYLDPYTLRDEQVTDAITHHLPNFYKAWADEWDKVQGGMRHGWDTATRIRPTRFDKTQLELYEARKAECLAKTDILRMSSFTTQVKGTGETFPATEIDVGSAAIDRASTAVLSTTVATNTFVDGNNSANATGTIDTVEAYFYSIGPGNNFRVGTFSDGGSNSLTCRDSELIGEVTSTGKNTYSGLDITISSGDYIGADSNTVIKALRLDRGTSGGTGTWSVSGSVCSVSTTTTFSWSSGGILSLYGTGETAEEPDIYAADMRRTVTKVSVYPSDTTRALRQVQSYGADTLRTLAQLQSLASDTFRQLCAMQSYAADTWRELVATLNDIYQADLLRTLRQAQDYPADTLRPTTQAQQYAADALRLLAALSAYAADTHRLIQQAQLSQWDTSRPIRGIQTFGADTVRLIQLDLYDRFTGDTRRIIWIPTPFIGPPFVVEVRNESGQLLGIPRVVFSGQLTTVLNGPDALTFTIAANDPVLQHLNSRSLLYVRNDEGTVVSVCRLLMDERSHQ